MKVARIYSKGSSNCYSGYMLRTLPDMRLRLEASSNNVCKMFFDSTNAISVGVWNYIAINFDRTTGGKMYINGALDATWSTPLPDDLTSTYDIYIGYNQIDNIEAWHGAIDDFKLFDSALTDSDVSDEYSNS